MSALNIYDYGLGALIFFAAGMMAGVLAASGNFLGALFFPLVLVAMFLGQLSMNALIKHGPWRVRE